VSVLIPSRSAVASAVADENGEFHLGDLDPGRYDLLAAADGLKPAIRVLTLEPGPSHRTEVVLRGDATVVVTALDHHLEVLEDSSLDLMDETGRLVASSTTGQLKAVGLLAGRYRVVGRAVGYISAASELTVHAGEVHQCELELDRGSGLIGRVVAGRAECPVPGARIRVFDHLGQVAGTVTAAEDGRFGLHDLPPGIYEAVLEPITARAQSCSLASGQETEITFRLGRSEEPATE
jgi:uncharacterized surface anchored protein